MRYNSRSKIEKLVGKDLTKKIIDCFRDEKKAIEWFNTPIKTFKGISPQEYYQKTKDKQYIIDAIRRIEHGIFA